METGCILSDPFNSLSWCIIFSNNSASKYIFNLHLPLHLCHHHPSQVHCRWLELISRPCLPLPLLLQADLPSQGTSQSVSSVCSRLSAEHNIQTPTQFLSYSSCQASCFQELAKHFHLQAYSFFPLCLGSLSLFPRAASSSFRSQLRKNSLEKAPQTVLSVNALPDSIVFCQSTFFISFLALLTVSK